MKRTAIGKWFVLIVVGWCLASELVSYWRRPPPEGKATIQFAGRAVELEFSECVVCTTGKSAGKLRFSVEFSRRGLEQRILGNLRVRFPGERQRLGVSTMRLAGRRADVTMDSELAQPGEDVPPGSVPERAEVFWLEESERWPVCQMRVRAQPAPSEADRPQAQPQ